MTDNFLIISCPSEIFKFFLNSLPIRTAKTHHQMEVSQLFPFSEVQRLNAFLFSGIFQKEKVSFHGVLKDNIWKAFQ